MKKSFSLILVVLLVATTLFGCSQSSPTSTPLAIEKASTNSSTKSSTVSFTNKFGTDTTICAHSGCNNYIATSGDTNCCTTHSRKCLECGDYIDEDATYCMSCLEDSIKPSTNSNSSSSSGGEFWCMGKNDTCQNKTSDPLDLFCSSCDKNNDNVED